MCVFLIGNRAFGIIPARELKILPAGRHIKCKNDTAAKGGRQVHILYRKKVTTMISLYHQAGICIEIMAFVSVAILSYCGVYECLSGMLEMHDIYTLSIYNEDYTEKNYSKMLIFPFALIFFLVWYPFYLCRKAWSAEEDPARYEKLLLEYKEKRDDILVQFRNILSQGGSIKLCPDEPGRFLTAMPDGETGFIDFEDDIEDCFAAGIPECIKSCTDPDSLLASPEVMIIRSEKRDAETAAEHIIEKTVRACGILENSTSLYISDGGRTVIGINDYGQVFSVLLDLPAGRLFKGLEKIESCSDGVNVFELLMDSMVSKEELAKVESCGKGPNAFELLMYSMVSKEEFAAEGR